MKESAKKAVMFVAIGTAAAAVGLSSYALHSSTDTVQPQQERPYVAQSAPVGEYIPHNNDYYYIGISVEDAAAMIIREDRKPPTSMEFHEGRLYGFIQDTELDDYSEYIAVDSLHAISASGKTVLEYKCSDSKPACILAMFE